MRRLILATLLVYGTLATAQTFTVRARLANHAGVPKHMVEKAQAEAIYVAKTGGIRLVFGDSNKPLDFNFVATDCEGGAGKAILGQTLVGNPHTSAYAYIYFNGVLTASRNTDLSPGDLLGDVIAHELGHLLGLHHGPDGIMTPTWTCRQLALLARRRMPFSQAEALEMQTEIRVRRMLQHDASDLVQIAAHKRPL